MAFSLLLVGSAFPDDSFPASDAVVLRCDAQKLEGHVTSSGLRVLSIEKNEAFRLVTQSLGREETVEVSDEGRVHPSEKLIRLERALLTEEYSVSTEGLRQDFLIHERPNGSGPLRLMLKVEGAACESLEQGVKLTLVGSGREIAYSKLKVTDARGKERTAMMHAASTSMIEIVVVDEGAAYPLRIDPTLSDADWVSLNNDILGVRGTIYCFVDDGAGNLYAGGDFTHIGGITTNHIARWDGTRWWPVGGGLDDGEFGWVDCLGFGGGNLYVGGNFSSAGGVPVNRIARWDGTTWHALGSGLTGSPQAIAVDGSNVFVGGSLTQAGGASVNSIARWDGSAWSAVGSGCNGQVNSLLFHNGLLYAGGAFTSAGGTAANRVAAWNGTTWSSLGIGLAGTVKRLLMFQGALVAGGESGVVSWNGSAWSLLDAPAVSDLATDGTSLYFVWTSSQFPEVYRYIPGVSSEVIGTLINTFGLSGYPVFASFQGEIYVSKDAFREVHRYDETTGITTRTQVNNLARWNGAEWSPVSKNINNTVACMASENGQVVIGGRFTTAGGTNARRVALWNGTSWQALGNGLDKSVIAIAKHGADVYAAEIVESFSFPHASCRVQHWNGSSWQVLGGVFGDRILALHWHNGSLYAAGSFFYIGEDERVKIARWSGTQWEQVGEGIPLLHNPVRAMVSMGDDLYVGGYGVAKWNGLAWSALPGEVDGDVYSLAVHEGHLLAGGDFTSIDAINFNGLARWNGTQWSTFPLWTGKDVIAMAVHGAELYLVTQFLSVGRTEFPLQQWNGSAWKLSDMEFSQPGESISFNIISSMAVASPGKLWVGGFFEQVWRGTNFTLSPYLIQANIPGSTLSTQETWRQTHFGTYSNAGNTADAADFDLDGLPNLLEYAFGLNPTQGVSRALPVPQVNGSNYVVSFTQPVGVSGVTYGAEWSTTLAPGSWVSIPNTGTAPQYTFSVPLSGNTRVFVRLKVMTP
ncbi:MAG: hypothetical protein IPK22_25095 [Verrucomicrobiaceae bacterium]|nr:hypothetical protein [Verrucomicrobiaceae bacterium]